jgi:hypothetical protein
MSPRLFSLVLLLCILASPRALYGQQSTEMFVPIGQSPGLSGRTMLGTVDSVDVARGTLTMTNAAGERYTVRVGEKTWIWLDRSGVRQPNGEGSLSDCEPGQRIEVYYGNVEPDDGEAVWIKMEAS